MLIILCYGIVYFLEGCIFWQYCENLFSSKHEKHHQTIFLFGAYLLLFMGSLLNSPVINLLLFFIVNNIYILLTYHQKTLTALYHALFVTISMLLSELCVSGIFSYLKSDFYGESAHIRNIILFSVISKLLYFIILQCTSQFIRQRISQEISFEKNSLFFNIIPLLSAFIALVFMSVCSRVRLSLSLDILISICAIMLLAINIFMAWVNTSTQYKTQQLLDLKILLQKEYDTARYFDALHQQDEKQKILIHDIQKHLQAINQLNQNGEPEKVSFYIHELTASSDLQCSIRMCDNTLLNTILFCTKQKCQNAGVSFLTDIRGGCVNLLCDYDITSLFSNLLDNAFEATQHTKNGFIELYVTPRKDRHIVITMINSCPKNPFISQGRELSTSKSDKLIHGYGLKSIQRVIHKYNGDSNYYFNDKDNTFHTVILLKSEDFS